MPYATITTLVTNPAFVTTLNVNIGSPANGDLVICLVSSSGSDLPNTPSGWTQLFRLPSGSNTTQATGFYRLCNGSEGATVAVALAATQQHTSAASYRCVAGSFVGVPEAAAAAAVSQVYWAPSLSPSWGVQDTTWVAFLASAFTPSTLWSNTDAAYGNTVSTTGNNLQFSQRAQKRVATEQPPEVQEPFASNGILATIAIQGTASSGPTPAARARYRRLCGVQP